MPDLKLLALDADDLAVISAHVQDAALKVGDMGLARQDRRFALLMNRFAWEADGSGKPQRKRSALRFEHVEDVKYTGVDLKSREGVLELLSVTFEPTDAPSGIVELTFAGGCTLRLSVECLEVRLHDLGGVWAAKQRPQHDLSDVLAEAPAQKA